MKDMNNTLVLNSSDNQQSTDALKAIFHDSCSKHGVAAGNKDTVIKNGMALFEINASGDVFPLSSYPTVASFVIAHRGDIVQPVDLNGVTKEQLYNRLVKAATAQKMGEYRRLRKQFSTMA